MYFRGKRLDVFKEGPTPLDEFMTALGAVIETRTGKPLTEEEDRALREPLQEMADQIENEAYSHATRTGGWSADY